jgi:hypothetical protein
MMPHMGVPWDKDHEGRIYVYVDPSEMSPETRGARHGTRPRDSLGMSYWKPTEIR